MINSSSRTHRGNVRKVNEDAILCHPEYKLYAVADGMGGHAAGDVASQSIITELENIELDNTDNEEAIAKIDALLSDINCKINSGRIVDNSDSIVGSTIVIAYIIDNTCTCFWVGDSRLYIYRNNRLYQITKDHSLVQKLIDDGQLSPEEASRHPKANVITRALGVSAELEVDINQLELQSGDKLLLCSDGLYNEIDSTTMIASLQEEQADAIANNLLGEVLIRSAADNVSLIVITS